MSQKTQSASGVSKNKGGRECVFPDAFEEEEELSEWGGAEEMNKRIADPATVSEDGRAI